MTTTTAIVLFALGLFALPTAHAQDTIPSDPFRRFLLNWQLKSPPPVSAIPNDSTGAEIKYGRELFTRTAYYLGPEGTVGQYLGNRMNCQNCHPNAGTTPFGGSLITVHARYPQYRERDNNIITLGDRINQCIKRPHNGKPLPIESRENRAMQLYIAWLGQGQAIGKNIPGDSLERLPLLDRAADPDKGRAVYVKHCETCHGKNGEGVPSEDGKEMIYPPLWGPGSFTIGSSMNRVRMAAAFIKNNMPFGTATWQKPVLTLEEAYDVAAFINDDRINPRPPVDTSKDYPNLAEKPVDCGYGPYDDPFSVEQHKFGPWQPIIDYKKKK
jgi:thiosulfate dehydrogenase